MAIRFYFDADIIGLGKLPIQVRPDVTYAGDRGGVGIDRKPRPPSPIVPSVLDPDWIPKIAALGWLVITRDRHSRPAERQEISRALVTFGSIPSKGNSPSGTNLRF